MPQVLAFIGYHNSGKTTLIRKVYKELTSRGYSLGIIKSTKHLLEPLHKSGSDTELYTDQGVKRLAVVTPEAIIMRRPNTSQNIGALAISLFPEVDLVLCEGFKNATDIKKIEVVHSKIKEGLLKDKVNGVIAIVSDFEIDGIKNFRFEQVTKLCDFIEDTVQLPLKSKQDEIYLLVDGRRIPLKRFVRDSMKGTICGYVGSLRFTENAKNIEIFIKIKK